MIRTLVVFLVFLFLNPHLLIGQEKVVSDKEYSTFVDKLGYDKTKKGLRLREQFKPKSIEDTSDNSPKLSFGAGASILQIFAYFLIFSLIVFILYLIFSNVHVDKKLESLDIDYDEIEDLEDIDAKTMYKAALAEGNHLLAIRMHFIICLQELNQQGKITWEKEKTNRDYYRQISEQEIKQPFRDIANIFERCCYADVTLELPDFNRYDQRFLDFLNLLK